MAFLLHDARDARPRSRPRPAPEPARARRRLWRADLLQASAAASVAIAIALYLANGGAAGFGSPAEVVDSLGIISGLAGTDLVLVMFILAARVPVIDQTVGQDRAMALHRSLGKPAFYLILGHVLLLLVGYAMTDGASLIDEAVTMWSLPDMPLAVIGFGLLTTVVVTSLVAVRRRLRYEVWHVTHVLAYAAAIAALPHQFSLGGLFTAGAWKSWYWIALTALAFGSVIVWRIAVPIVRSMRHALTVVAVEPLAGGAASIRLRGRELDRLGASGGQFFVWRFLSREQWWQAHPYSLSAAPGGDELRITVRALGHGSAALFTVRPGTRVAIEGPYGIFSEASRSRQRIALVAAGIGVTPIRSLLEDARFHPGGATVVLRTPGAEEGWLLDEIRELCRKRGATLLTVPGRRGAGWLTEAANAEGFDLASLVPDLADTDLYVCGPREWADAVVQDARSAGMRPEQIHHERFDW